MLSEALEPTRMPWLASGYLPARAGGGTIVTQEGGKYYDVDSHAWRISP